MQDMDLIVTTSRGSEVAPYFSQDPSVWCHVVRGGRLPNLTDDAIQMVQDARTLTQDPIVVYMLAGLPDSTEKIVDYYNGQRYEEVIFAEDPWVAENRMIQLYTDSRNRIMQEGATPVYCTIMPMRLEIRTLID